jgi:hypothetical protein
VRIPVVWHTFVTGTFDIGRETVALSEEVSIGLYNPMRCVIDAFRLRHREGTGLAHEALRRWLARDDARPAELLAVVPERRTGAAGRVGKSGVTG